MSLHRSLKTKKKKQRTVKKRYERMMDLIAKGKWKDTMSVFGLPKQKIKIVKKKKKKEDDEEKTT